MTEYRNGDFSTWNVKTNTRYHVERHGCRSNVNSSLKPCLRVMVQFFPATADPGALCRGIAIMNPSFEHQTSSIQYPVSSIQLPGTSNQRPVTSPQQHSSRLPAERSDPSGPTVEADGYLGSLDDHRNLAGAVGVFQHSVEMLRVFDYIVVVDLPAFLGKSFTSRPGIRSGILAEEQNFFRHLFLLVGLAREELT